MNKFIVTIISVLFFSPYLNQSASANTYSENEQNKLDGYEYVDLALPSGTLWAKYNATGMYDDESNSLDPVVAYPNDICLEMSNPSWIQDDQDLCKEVAKTFYTIIAQMVYSIPNYVDTSIFPINVERVYDQSEKCCDGFRNTYKMKLSFPTSMEVI